MAELSLYLSGWRQMPISAPFRGARGRTPRTTVALSVLLLVIMAGCAATRAPAERWVELQTDYQRLRERLQIREDSTRTASYRVRWRAQRIEPHAGMILHIDCKAPGRFRIVGKGPLDILMFTAWVTDSEFVLLDHREGQIRRGALRELWAEDTNLTVPPFDVLLSLLSGGCGVGLPDSLTVVGTLSVSSRSGDFPVVDKRGRTAVLDLGRRRLKRLVWGDTDLHPWEMRVEFGGFSDHYPFWELRSARYVSGENRGEYHWQVLAQKYNHELPDHLFVPPLGR